ncbi:MAG: nuclear transport factor 2 family protein [Rhodospirillaceae bacterium]|nr:nuclear transport factor 2 family protein [Rhodospirillaceae bacterium]
MDTQTLERDFNNAFSVFTGEGNYEDFYGFFDPDALMISEDNPFIMDQIAFRDHMSFLASNMEILEWVLRQPTYQVFNDTGLVTADLTVRGKPKSHGFRQRHSVLSAICYWNGSEWRGANLHTSTLLAHIYEMSPG